MTSPFDRATAVSAVRCPQPLAAVALSHGWNTDGTRKKRPCGSNCPAVSYFICVSSVFHLWLLLEFAKRRGIVPIATRNGKRKAGAVTVHANWETCVIEQASRTTPCVAPK